MVSNSPSMPLSCTISEIKRDIGRKSWFFHIPLYSMPPLTGVINGGSHWNIAISFGTEKLECGATRQWNNFEDMCNCLDTLLACSWQTDGQTSCRTMHRRRAVKTDKTGLYCCKSYVFEQFIAHLLQCTVFMYSIDVHSKFPDAIMIVARTALTLWHRRNDVSDGNCPSLS